MLENKFVLILYTVKLTRISKLLKLFENQYRVFLKDIRFKLSGEVYRQAKNDLDDINKTLHDNNCPRILELKLAERHGKKDQKVLIKNIDYKITVKNDYSQTKIEYIKRDSLKDNLG